MQGPHRLSITNLHLSKSILFNSFSKGTPNEDLVSQVREIGFSNDLVGRVSSRVIEFGFIHRKCTMIVICIYLLFKGIKHRWRVKISILGIADNPLYTLSLVL